MRRLRSKIFVSLLLAFSILAVSVHASEPRANRYNPSSKATAPNTDKKSSPPPTQETTTPSGADVNSGQSSKESGSKDVKPNVSGTGVGNTKNVNAISNKRLVAGAFAKGMVNANAKNLGGKKDEDGCGESDSIEGLPATSTNNGKGSTNSRGKSATSASSGKSSTGAEKSKQAREKSEEDECKDFILIFADDASNSEINRAAASVKARVMRSFNNVFKGALVNGPAKKIAALSKNPRIQSIELDGIVSTQAIYSNVIWGLDRLDQRNLPLNNSFDDLQNSASLISVYVVDTGIYAEHSEFSNRVAAGASSIVDGLGSWDCNGHGTHVAGTIAGNTFGVAKSATLIPVRVLDCSGSGSYSGVIAGLDWIAANHPSGLPGIVNMSLGGPASSSLDSAVNNLIARGLTVVVAAGNSASDACKYSPSRVPDAITVAASAIDDSRASFSNFGSCIDIFAPGVGITSAWNTGMNSTTTINGTSMAAPHVSGVLARFLYANSSSSVFQVSNSMAKSATIDAIKNVGSGTVNRLLYSEIIFDSTEEPLQTQKPGKSRAGTNPGRGNKS